MLRGLKMFLQELLGEGMIKQFYKIIYSDIYEPSHISTCMHFSMSREMGGGSPSSIIYVNYVIYVNIKLMCCWRGKL